jgi:hypothetical protein
LFSGIYIDIYSGKSERHFPSEVLFLIFVAEVVARALTIFHYFVARFVAGIVAEK